VQYLSGLRGLALWANERTTVSHGMSAGIGVGGLCEFSGGQSPRTQARSDRGGSSVRAAFALICVVGLLLTVPALCLPGWGDGRPGSANPVPSSDPARDTVSVPLNVSYCGVLGPDVTGVADQPNYTANVSALWSDLCHSPAFIEVINEWGNLQLVSPGSGANLSYWAAANLSLQVGGVTGGVPNVYFVVAWAARCDNLSLGTSNTPCSYQEDWSGNLSTDHLSGPFSSERISICMCGPSPSGTPFPYGWVAVAVVAGAASVLASAVVLRRRRPPGSRREPAST